MADTPLKSLIFPGLDDRYTIPAKTSDLTNDSGFVNAAGAASAAPVQSVNGSTGAVTVSVPAASSTTPSMDGVGSAGSATTYARADHVHPSDSTKLDIAQGAGNAGKFMVVGSDGNITAVTMTAWAGGSY